MITDQSGQGFSKLDPSWSPDESLLAFAGTEAGNLSMALYVATAAGGAIQPVLKGASVNVFDPCWIPAGGL